MIRPLVLGPNSSGRFSPTMCATPAVTGPPYARLPKMVGRILATKPPIWPVVAARFYRLGISEHRVQGCFERVSNALEIFLQDVVKLVAQPVLNVMRRLYRELAHAPVCRATGIKWPQGRGET